MSRHKRIFFLEDEHLLRFIQAEALEKAGHQVVAAESLMAARRVLQDEGTGFDVLVLTVHLQDGDGLDLCAELRASGVTTPILIQSAFSDAEHFQRAFEAGADFYLVKPYSPGDLAEHIEFLLAMPPLARSSRRALAAGSNLLTIQEYEEQRIRSALAHLAAISAELGVLSKREWEQAGKVKPSPFHAEAAAALERALLELRRLSGEEAPPAKEVARLRAKLLELLQALLSWLAVRATVAADEAAKGAAKLGVTVVTAAAVAHAMGLKVDLMHIIAALGALAGGK